MTKQEMTRRGWLTIASTGAVMAAGGTRVASGASANAPEPFLFGLNTSTVRGQKLPIARVAELTAAAGFRGIEPWIDELDAHVKAGGSLDDLGKTFRDLNLGVESAIGFFDWAVDDPARRRKGLDEAKRNMELVRAVGGKRLAAPPAGATDRTDMDLDRIADRYRTLLELGDTMGVVPQVEVWGFSKTLSRLAEAAHVAVAADHPKACVLADVYHLYKGGSGFNGLRLMSKDALQVIHVNDYPANPPRATITDADRIFPGDGVAPLKAIFRDLHAIGFTGMLSVELFNRDYWKDDPATVLKTAFQKLRTAVYASFDEIR